MEGGQLRIWARSVAACPHCGRTVMFDAAGRCPACGVPGDAPVTEEDHARIAEVARRDAARPEARKTAYDDGSPDDATGMLVGFVFGLIAVAYVNVTKASDRYRRAVRRGFLGHLVLNLVLVALGALLD